jgi:transcriptional regulator with XRE-family HTH domain
MDSKIITRIRQTRLLKGYSQEYMAYRLNISQQSYSRMESGRQDLKIMQLETIAGVLEIPLTDLLSDYSRQYIPVNSENVMPLLNELESVLKRLVLAGKAPS